jgi:protein gp37
MGATSIEWTDRSVNPFRAKLSGRIGHYCEKVSAGCKNCYSSRMQRRFGMPSFPEQRNSAVEHFLDASKLEEVLKRRAPTKWFWCDMTDMFGSWVPFEWIAACFAVMAATPHHTHQVLTKRPENATEFFSWLDDNSRQEDGEISLRSALTSAFTDATGDDSDEATLRIWDAILEAWRPEREEPPWPLPNVHLGVSVENNEQRHRIAEILKCPAAVHWVSAEPLLGALDLPLIDYTGQRDSSAALQLQLNNHGRGVSWVVVGGESGVGARGMNLEWIRSLVEQCRAGKVACFVKQFGANPYEQPPGFDRTPIVVANRKGGDLSEIDGDWPRQFPVSPAGP